MQLEIKLLDIARVALTTTLLFAGLILYSWTYGQTHQNNNDLKQNLSNDTLFHEAMHVLGGVRMPVVRWDSPINLAVLEAHEQSTLIFKESIFNEISLFTGIRYTAVPHDIDHPLDCMNALKQTPPTNTILNMNSIATKA